MAESGSEKFKEGTEAEDGVLDHRCGVGCVPFMEVNTLASTHGSFFSTMQYTQNNFTGGQRDRATC